MELFISGRDRPISGVIKAGILLLSVFLLPTAATADDYADARADLVAAYQAEDYAAMRVAAAATLVARPEYPGALFNKALAEILDGDADAAMETLGRLVEKGIDYGVEDIDAFTALAGHPAWSSYLANIDRIRQPLGQAETAGSFDKPEFIPEGIAVAEGGGIVLGGIRHGELLIEALDSDAIVLGPAGHWSVFGMRFDDREGLWFASSRVPQYAGVSDRSAYRAGLFRLSLDTLEISDRARLPVNGNDQVLGDLVIADADTIYTTDSVDGQVEKLAVPASASDYGIDGLYRRGNQLIAIQNGIQPHRVTAFSLSNDGLAIESADILAMNLPEFDEPTLGTIVGDDFYFVANSHWNRFDADNNLPDDLTGPIVLRLELPAR